MGRQGSHRARTRHRNRALFSRSRVHCVWYRWGVPAVVAKRSAKEVDPVATKMLWEMSEKACGEWQL